MALLEYESEHAEEQIDATARRAAAGGLGPTLMLRSTVTISSMFHVEEADGIWTVRDVETGIFGSGKDEPSAFRDFIQALYEHRDVLERQDALSDVLARHLEYLRRLIP